MNYVAKKKSFIGSATGLKILQIKTFFAPMKSVKEIGPADVWDVLDVRDVVDVWHFEKVEIKTIDINKRWIRSIFNCEKNEEKFLSKEILDDV